MERPINIIVTATKRKRKQVPAPLHFRHLADVAFSRRCREWTTLLADYDAPQTVAGSLYAGDHWQLARDVPQHAKAFGWCARLWVCSPGYGLVRAQALLHAYSANYSSRHPDSVLTGCNADRWSSLQRWWLDMATWPGPEPGQARNLSMLAENFRDCPMLVIASKTVINVIEPDLIAAIERLRRKADLLIVSGGSNSVGPLGSHVLPCDARLQRIFGGARMSLNIRTARFLLEGGPEENLRQAWAGRLTDLLCKAPPVVQYERRAMTDDEVAAFIVRSIRSKPSASWSGLLRQLRDGGYRCEQKRFAAIFKQVASEINDS